MEKHQYPSTSTTTYYSNLPLKQTIPHHFEKDATLPSTKENDKPLLDDISTFLETMHSKNLTLKKLAKVQQSKLETLKNENHLLKLETQQKDRRILQLQTEIRNLRIELKSLANRLDEDVSSSLHQNSVLSDTENQQDRNKVDSNNEAERFNYETSSGSEKDDEHLLIETSKTDNQLASDEKYIMNSVTQLFDRINEKRRPQRRAPMSYLYSWSYLALKQAVFVSLEANTWS